MGMDSIDVEFGFPRHHKTVKLRRLVGVGAITYVIQMWCWAGEFCKDGVLGDAAEVTYFERTVCGWDGATGELQRAMVDAGFLKRTKKHGLVIHGFKERNEHLIQLSKVRSRAAKEKWRRLRAKRSTQPQGDAKQRGTGGARAGAGAGGLQMPNQPSASNDTDLLEPPEDTPVVQVVVGQLVAVFGRNRDRLSMADETFAMQLAAKWRGDHDQGRARILYAFKEAHDAGVLTPKYVRAVCDNYGKAKTQSMADGGF